MAGRTFIEAWSLSFSDFEFIQTCMPLEGRPGLRKDASAKWPND